MPRGDRRGPEGAGPMTGRGLGYCAGNDRPGFAANAAPQGLGRGFRGGAGRRFAAGRGRGMGYGRGLGYAAVNNQAPAQQPTPQQQLKKSKQQLSKIRSIGWPILQKICRIN